MKRLVEYALPQGGTIIVEVDSPEEEGVVQAGRVGQTIQKAQEGFEEALGRVRPMVQAILTQIKSIPDPPAEVEVRFGIKMNAEVGAVLASTGVEANYEVTLTWKDSSQ